MKKYGKLLFILLPLLSLGFSSCSAATTTSDVTIIRVLNWEDYIYEQDVEEGYENDDMVLQFETYMEENYPEFGKVKVVYETTDTNETMFNEIQTGKSHYDLICPSDYMLQKLLKGGYLDPIDRNKLPNYLKYVSPYMKDCLDKITVDLKKEDNSIETLYLKDYTIGYMWGTLGLVFNPNYETFQTRELSYDKVISDMSTYASLWDKNYQRTISVKDSMRDTYAIGVLQAYENELKEARETYFVDGDANKYNAEVSEIMNRTDKDTIEKVSGVLSELKKNVFGLEVDSGKQDIVTGKIGINFAWSGDACYSMFQAEDELGIELLYSVPELGSNIWFDGWCIPKNDARTEKQYDLAHYFIDFLSHPDYASQNVDYIGYTSFVGGDSMLELYRDYYDIRTELIYEYDEENDEYYSLYYFNNDEEVEVTYEDCHFESDSDPLFDDVELYYYNLDEEKVDLGETYNERLIILEEWKVDLEYFFENTLEGYDEDAYFFYSDNYLPYEDNVSVGSSFFCQLPDIETMTRCAVMKDFGDDNDKILLLWENFKSDPLPMWATILFAIEITAIAGFIVYYFLGKNIKLRLRKKRKAENK